MAVNLPIRYGGSMCGEEERRIGYAFIDKAIDSGQWQTAEETAAFEWELSQFMDVKNSIVTTSGSAAGLLALAALELPKGSEVIIPAVTFPTIFNIILQCGLKPVVVDCEVGTYNLDIKLVQKAISKKTKAIIAVHAVGNPADMPALKKIAKRHKLKLIEDNCDGFGTTINGWKSGSFSDISFTSTHAAHIITTGVGGVVFTNDDALALRVRQYRDWGRQANTNEPHKVKTLPADYNPRFVYDKIGYNFQILELQSAIGRVQLKKVQDIKNKRKDNFDYLVQHLNKYDDLILPQWIQGADVCWFALPLSTKGDRGPLVQHLEENKIETRSMFAGNILRHPAYKGLKIRHTSLKQADWILEHSFWIGVHPRMTREDLEYVVKTFDDYYRIA